MGHQSTVGIAPASEQSSGESLENSLLEKVYLKPFWAACKKKKAEPIHNGEKFISVLKRIEYQGSIYTFLDICAVNFDNLPSLSSGFG